MSTRLYGHEQAPSYSPGATYNGHWEDVGAALTKAIGPVKADSRFIYDSATITRAETSTDPEWEVCLWRGISAPLENNITIDGTVEFCGGFYESNAAADLRLALHVWVTQGDSSTARGQLLNMFIGNEPGVVDNTARSSGAQAVSSVDALAGDRIIVEFGYRATNSVATSYSGSLAVYSNENQGDVVDNAAYNSLNSPWVEFSNNLTFVSDVRITQFSIEVALQQTVDPPARLSQMLVEALVAPIPPTRLSHMIVEVMVLPPPPIVAPTWTPLPVRCQATYWANLYDWNGNLVAVFDDFKPLTIEHRINGYSNCTFSIDGQDSRISLFKLDYFLEVWRDIGDLKYIEFEGVHRSDQLQYTEGGHWIYTSYSRSFEDFLMRRCVMYRNLAKVLEADGVTWHGYTLKNIAADDAMKEFVNENLGPGANNHVVGDPNTRLVNGAMPNFNIEPNTSQGPTYFANFSYLNLYEVLQKIAEATGVDFKVRRFSGNQFEFITRYPMLGSDKSATLVFSPEYGNMTIPSWTLTRTEEVNVVAVLGQGENTYRHALTFERASTMDSPWNRRETTHDSSNDTGQGFIDTSTEVLNNLKAKEEFTFSVMQTDASAYGYDYVLGDVCTVKFGAITKQKKVTGIVINVSDGKEDIKVSFSDYPTVPPT